MDNIAEATLSDGGKLHYVIVDDPPKGAMKYTYFTQDRSRVIQFYNDPASAADENLRKRIQAIIGRFNPTRSEEQGGAKGTRPTMAEYFARRFCWPETTVREPEFGIVCPAYPEEFFFSGEPSRIPELNERIRGRDKKSRWFISSKLRGYFKPEQLGNFRSMLEICVSLAQSVRRMHQAGLAHSDLSCNNVLMNPVTGHCVVIDIDSLVVPDIYPPDVIGTNGYIAPEVLETSLLPFGDPGRVLPSTNADLHSLAVLLYEFLFYRHPLEGPKFHDKDPDRDEFLAKGREALFIENPRDTSNRPEDLSVTIADMGPFLERLFLRAFVTGLHHPDERPSAMDWEKALVQTYDLLHPCPNTGCGAKWFVLHDPRQAECPFCGRRINPADVLRLELYKPWVGRPGQWTPFRPVNLYDGMELYQWHFDPNCFPDEKIVPANRTPVARIRREGQRWVLMNEGVRGMSAQDGTPIPPGQTLELREGEVLRTGAGQTAYLMEVTHGR